MVCVHTDKIEKKKTVMEYGIRYHYIWIMYCFDTQRLYADILDLCDIVAHGRSFDLTVHSHTHRRSIHFTYYSRAHRTKREEIREC